jgi:electron transport complex protein RnfG
MTTDSAAVSTKAERFQNNYLLQAWLVLTLAFVSGVLLVGLQTTLNPQIEANKIKETKEKIPELLLESDYLQSKAYSENPLAIAQHSVAVEKNKQKKFYTVFEARHADGRLAGWVTKAAGQGYADKIELLFGLNPDATQITGLFILDQKETPGLGNKITAENWRGQFKMKPTAQPLKVIKGGNKGTYDIDAITGATISSKSVTDIINKTIGGLKTQLAAMQKNG